MKSLDILSGTQLSLSSSAALRSARRPTEIMIRSRKVILGVSWVISGRRYDDGPLPWGIMGVEENPP